MHLYSEKIRDLIRDLATAYIDNPEALRIEYQRAETADVYWMMSGHPEDEGKLVGAGGCHVDALERIIAQIGRSAGVTYTFRLLTRAPSQERVAAPRDVMEYDPGRARELLARLLEATGVHATVSVGPGRGPRGSLSFTFAIHADDAADYARLVCIDGARGSTLVAAFGTLFRAIGKKDGVRFLVAARH